MAFLEHYGYWILGGVAVAGVVGWYFYDKSQKP